MKKAVFVLFIVINSSFILQAQSTLKIEGTVVTIAEPGSSLGVVIPRSEPTILTYKNNSITSVNAGGYMLQAGDESISSTNNYLDGSVIRGNKFTWNGTDITSITHGVFTGYNINTVITYNYLNKVPMGIIRKSNGMTDVSGTVAYNIVINPAAVGIVVKGMNGIKIYNNTFYSNKTKAETLRGIIDIYENADISPAGSAKGTKIFNNIFYTKYPIYNLRILDPGCLQGFESDYNIFWCEAGEPIFYVAGDIITFSQWQALGYDKHSVVIDPNFIDFTDFIPDARLDYGTNLGETWQSGLSVNAVWGSTDPATTNQNGTWQVGARIYNATTGTDNIPDLSDTEDRKVIIYPNPSRGFLNISIEDPTLEPQIIKIRDLYGNIVFTNSIEQGIKNVQIHENFKPGNYIVTLESGRIILYTQKLIIAK